jgi:hypothetical protein
MSEVSYRAFLGQEAPGRTPEAFSPLPATAIGTRRREADRTVTVRVSKRQAKWLERVDGVTGDGVDADAVLRALIDLGQELEIDWALIAGGGRLRDAVRESVLVRRTGTGA